MQHTARLSRSIKSLLVSTNSLQVTSRTGQTSRSSWLLQSFTAVAKLKPPMAENQRKYEWGFSHSQICFSWWHVRLNWILPLILALRSIQKIENAVATVKLVGIHNFNRALTRTLVRTSSKLKLKSPAEKTTDFSPSNLFRIFVPAKPSLAWKNALGNTWEFEHASKELAIKYGPRWTAMQTAWRGYS